MSGRPIKFKTPEILQELINDYFTECDKKDKPYTVSGLAVALDTSRETLMNLESDYEYDEVNISREDRKRYFDAVKRAKAKIEASYEERLFKGTPVGAIFALKNMKTGWADERSLNQNIKTDIIDDSQAETLLARRVPISEVTADLGSSGD